MLSTRDDRDTAGELLAAVGGDDSRVEPPLVGGEREILVAFLDWHRETFALKCGRVPDERLSDKAIPPSGPACTGCCGISRESSRWWFRLQFARHNGHADLLRERIDGATGF